uniref:hypothetical protein n=1 Tax=Prosthecobacter sp. TaxID=1965333 RepID=UPI0037831D00
MLNRARLFGIVACGIMLGASCSTHGNKTGAPALRVKPNATGLEIGAMRTHGPENFLGSGPPNISSGVTATLKRKKNLHNQEACYFIKAPGKFQVVSMEGPGAANYPALMSTWRGLFDADLNSGSTARTTLYQKQLSEIPWMNAGRAFHAKLRSRTFPWGRALLFLTTYTQGPGPGPVNNDMLVLVVQGFTHDGRFAVNGRFEIHHPQLPDSADEKPRVEKHFFDLDEPGDAAEKWLDAQPDESFDPSLQDYEAFLSALEIK